MIDCRVTICDKSLPEPTQVKVDPGVPTKLIPTKPKFWLTCSLTVPAKMAVQIDVT